MDLVQDPDPLFNETDPRIRIRYSMKRIRGSGSVIQRDGSEDPDPLFNETDPRIRIIIKMKRIRNTERKEKQRVGYGIVPGHDA